MYLLLWIFLFTSCFTKIVKKKQSDFFSASKWWRGGSIGSTSNFTFHDSKKLPQIFLVLLMQTGFEPPIFCSRIWHSTNWATPSLLAMSYRYYSRSLSTYMCMYVFIKHTTTACPFQSMLNILITLHYTSVYHVFPFPLLRLQLSVTLCVDCTAAVHYRPLFHLKSIRLNTTSVFQFHVHVSVLNLVLLIMSGLTALMVNVN